MASATLRFYAELSDRLPADRRKVDFEVSFERGQSIGHLIESLNFSAAEVDLILANGEPVGFSYTVQEGDRFSIYPEFRALNPHFSQDSYCGGVTECVCGVTLPRTPRRT
jgi:hypothetical protein